MSRGMKYYKKEDVISFLNTHCPKDMWEYQIADLPTIEVSEDCISKFRDYQIEWLTAHCDIELEPVLEDWIVRFLKDTAEMFVKENAPSVVPTVRENRQVERAEGEWIDDGMGIEKRWRCSECGELEFGYNLSNYCPNCGAKMKG